MADQHLLNLRRYEDLLKYELAIQEAGDRLMDFAQFTSPHDRFPDDPTRSTFLRARHLDILADLMESVERGEILKAIINMPPRHGKSRLSTIAATAWISGRNPGKEVMVATYGENFARDFKAKVAEIIQGQRFRQVFPEYHLIRTGADRLVNHLEKNLFFLGRRSPTTGRGGDCFPAGTLIETSAGPIAIEKIFHSPVSHRVVCLTHGGISEKSVTAASSRQADGLRRITTASGRVVEASREHPFLTGHGWVKARDVAAGDRIVCLLRAGRGKDGVRDAEIRGARAGEPLLLSGVLGAWGERAPLRRETLRGVRGEDPKIRVARNKCGAGMLRGLLGNSTGAPQGRSEIEPNGILSSLSLVVPRPAAGREAQGVLLSDLRGDCAFAADVRDRQPEVEARGDRASAEARPQLVSHDATDGAGARRARLCHLPGQRDPIGGASPRQRSDAQFRVQSGDAMLGAPSPMARGDGPEAEYDTVAVVEDLCGDTTVYDLQIDGSHNFFANSILVHNCLLVDDPTKDDREVRYVTYRDDVWDWFTQTLLSRRHTDKAPVLVCQTRWHDDDIVGRITDRTNPKYSKEFADGWQVINMPALAEEDDPLGRKVDEALWPERFGTPYLLEMRAANPVSFSSLYQSDPTPGEGVHYLAADLHTYDRSELPDGLRMHAASDHAVSTTTQADPTCMGVFGICPKGDAYILPDLPWRRMKSDEAVEEMIRLMKAYKPIWWYAERGHISRAIGPFLKKRMQEEGVYTPIIEDQPVADKLQRSHSARSRCAQGRIRFPSYAGWWPRAKLELLKFPNGRHDDFCDFLSIVGMKLETHVRGTVERRPEGPKPGTWGHLKQQWAAQDADKKARAARAGW